MKIKLLSLAFVTIGLLSCGENQDSSAEETAYESNSNIDLVSYVHGVMFSNQLKNQKLPFINPQDLVKDFAEYKENGIGEFNPENAINELRELAQRTENFQAIGGADLEKAKSIFSKLYFDDIKQSPIANEMNFEKFEEGMLTFWEDGKTPSQDSVTIFTDYMRNAVIKIGNDFLAENSSKEGVKVTPSGLQYQVLEEGFGERPTSDTSKVLAHYEGTLINGQKFDSSYDRGEPIEFPLNGVIAGWTEGLQLMKVGAKYKFYIPYNLGYGERGTRGIPPYSTLIFTVELKDVR